MQQRITRPLPSNGPQDPLAELARLIGQNDPFGSLMPEERREAIEKVIDTDGPFNAGSIHGPEHDVQLRRMVHAFGPEIATELGYRAVEKALSATAAAGRDWGSINRRVLNFRPGPIEKFAGDDDFYD